MGLGLIPSLTNYNFENVVYHTLNLRVPKFTYQQLTDWYTSPKYRLVVGPILLDHKIDKTFTKYFFIYLLNKKSVKEE